MDTLLWTISISLVVGSAPRRRLSMASNAGGRSASSASRAGPPREARRPRPAPRLQGGAQGVTRRTRAAPPPPTDPSICGRWLGEQAEECDRLCRGPPAHLQPKESATVQHVWTCSLNGIPWHMPACACPWRKLARQHQRVCVCVCVWKP